MRQLFAQGEASVKTNASTGIEASRTVPISIPSVGYKSSESEHQSSKENETSKLYDMQTLDYIFNLRMRYEGRKLKRTCDANSGHSTCMYFGQKYIPV